MKTYEFKNNVGTYNFTGLTMLAYVATLTISYYEIGPLSGKKYCINSSLNDFKVGDKDNGKKFTINTGIIKNTCITKITLSRNDFNRPTVIEINNTNWIRDDVIPVVFDSTTLATNRHIGINDHVYNFKYNGKYELRKDGLLHNIGEN